MCFFPRHTTVFELGKEKLIKLLRNPKPLSDENEAFTVGASKLYRLCTTLVPHESSQIGSSTLAIHIRQCHRKSGLKKINGKYAEMLPEFEIAQKITENNGICNCIVAAFEFDGKQSKKFEFKYTICHGKLHFPVCE